MATPLKDLIVLVADKDMESALKGLLARNLALGIREISFDIFVHPYKDPGCVNTADQFVRSFINQYRFALIMFDREGCGRFVGRENLEADVEQRLIRVGWENRSAAVVLDPELEVWIWTRSYHVAEALGWNNQRPSLRSWLINQNYLGETQNKPLRPKEAMEAALRNVKKPRSASIYLQLAQNVSLQGHEEPAFVKLQTTLQTWFPKENI
jgi:hypothetical protein